MQMQLNDIRVKLWKHKGVKLKQTINATECHKIYLIVQSSKLLLVNF